MFTNFIVEKIVETEHVALNEIQNKYISVKTVNSALFNSEELMSIVPVVYGGSEKALWRFDFNT